MAFESFVGEKMQLIRLCGGGADCYRINPSQNHGFDKTGDLSARKPTHATLKQLCPSP